MRTITKYIDAVKDSIEFHVGQNAKDNFDIIDQSGPDDIWFHINQASSCHVVATIPSENKYDKKQLKKIVIQGAMLCKQNSRYKSDHNISIMYTKIQHIKKTVNVGAVSIGNYKTLII